VKAIGEKLEGVKQLLAGGDVLQVEPVRELLQRVPELRLINGYGPTENTTFTCCWSGTPEEMGESVPIGKPIANTRVYVLNEGYALTPVGVGGELYIGGAGVARGYLERPELTAEQFVQIRSVSGQGAAAYRTGTWCGGVRTGTWSL
jgi:aspartate racemase